LKVGHREDAFRGKKKEEKNLITLLKQKILVEGRVPSLRGEGGDRGKITVQKRKKKIK